MFNVINYRCTTFVEGEKYYNLILTRNELMRLHEILNERKVEQDSYESNMLGKIKELKKYIKTENKQFHVTNEYYSKIHSSGIKQQADDSPF